jgi:hypothetical protein
MVRKMREFGIKNGMLGVRSNKNLLSVYESELEEVTKQMSTKDDEAEGFAAYEAGMREGEAKVAALVKRAQQAGTNDGAASKTSRIGDSQNWPEVQETTGPLRVLLIGQLASAYSIAYKEASLKATHQRARDLGRKDGKAGDMSHLNEIHAWPTVVELANDPATIHITGQIIQSYMEGHTEGSKR